MKKLLKNTRLHLILLAVSLLITTTILGLSAELTGTASYSPSFKVVADSSIKLSIDGTKYIGEPIGLNQTVMLSPTVKNESSVTVFLFAEITEMDENSFLLDGDVGLSGNWINLGIDGRKVFYWGINGVLDSVGTNGNVTLFNELTVKEDAPVDGVSRSISITVYAIQTLGLESKTPEQVWGNF